MKSFRTFRQDARKAIMRLEESDKKRIGRKKRIKNKVRTHGLGADASQSGFISNPVSSDDSENLIHIGGNNLHYEDSESTYYIFHKKTNRILARGIRGYENAKSRANELRKRYNLKWDDVKFRMERTNKNTYYKKGRIDVSKNYNPSKRTYMRGVNYSDGSYADLD